MATYYPLGRDFHVHPPSVFEQDLQGLLDLYHGHPDFLMEVGYPTSQTLGSSERMQAQFVEEAFTARDQHAERVQLMNFTWMHDISQAELDRYLQAVHRWLVTRQTQVPWRTRFDYAQRGGTNPLVALLLGVKSHGSGDAPSNLRSSGIEDHQAVCGLRYLAAGAQP